MMRIAACDAERKIKNVEAKDGRISWNFRPAQIDGFFVFFSTIAPRQYKSKGELLSCAEEYFREHMLEPERRSFYDLDGCNLQIIRKAVYNNGISIDETAAADAPIQIAVFPYTLRDGEITVYAQDESDLKNTAYIPYKIRYRKERKKKCFEWLGGKPSPCRIEMHRMKNFCEEIICYKVSGRKMEYPVTEKMMEQGFQVEIEKDAVISLCVEEEFKHLYRCIEE